MYDDNDNFCATIFITHLHGFLTLKNAKYQ